MTVLFSELQVPGWADSGEKIGLNDVEEAFHLMETGNVIRSVIEF